MKSSHCTSFFCVGCKFLLLYAVRNHRYCFLFVDRFPFWPCNNKTLLVLFPYLPTQNPKHSAPQARYVQAKLSVHDRSLKVATVLESLEMEMELLCLTGVEDQLQADVRPTLEILRNAGIKVGVWRLCGDGGGGEGNLIFSRSHSTVST